MINLEQSELIKKLAESKKSPRLRAPFALSKDEDSVQVLYNPIQPLSYIRPHRHENPELWLGVAGRIALLTFNEEGSIRDKYMLSDNEFRMVEVPGNVYHTAFALEYDSIFCNISLGPFNPRAHKEFPEWAPNEGDEKVLTYIEGLLKI